jgi:hypothetical protein
VLPLISAQISQLELETLADVLAAVA